MKPPRAGGPALRHLLVPLLAAATLSCTTPDQITPADLRSFTSDGCSRFPDGTPSHPTLWCRCCFAHDRIYWAGGSREEREATDRGLRRCVEGLNEPGIARLMFWGVRAAGAPYWPTSYRRGYGWPYLRGYKPLTPEERQAVETRLGEIDLGQMEQMTCKERG